MSQDIWKSKIKNKIDDNNADKGENFDENMEENVSQAKEQHIKKFANPKENANNLQNVEPEKLSNVMFPYQLPNQLSKFSNENLALIQMMQNQINIGNYSMNNHSFLNNMQNHLYINYLLNQQNNQVFNNSSVNSSNNLNNSSTQNNSGISNVQQNNMQNSANTTSANSSTAQTASSSQYKGGHKLSEKDKQRIIIENIIIGQEKRTTLMLRNIPNKYTLMNVVDEINNSFWGKYDYINLPIDYERKLNLGYAFINFVDPLHIILFYETYHNKRWTKYRSYKKMDMTYADKQGKKDINCKDDQTYFALEDKRFNFNCIKPKIEIPISYLDFFKKIYPNSVCVIEDKHPIYPDQCFIVKSLGKK